MLLIPDDLPPAETGSDIPSWNHKPAVCPPPKDGMATPDGNESCRSFGSRILHGCKLFLGIHGKMFIACINIGQKIYICDRLDLSVNISCQKTTGLVRKSCPAVCQDLLIIFLFHFQRDRHIFTLLSISSLYSVFYSPMFSASNHSPLLSQLPSVLRTSSG